MTTIAATAARRSLFGSRYSSSPATILRLIAIWENPWTHTARHRIRAGRGLYSEPYMSACQQLKSAHALRDSRAALYPHSSAWSWMLLSISSIFFISLTSAA